MDFDLLAAGWGCVFADAGARRKRLKRGRVNKSIRFVNHVGPASGGRVTRRVPVDLRGLPMNGAEVLDVGRDAIWLVIQLGAPVLIVGLVVGVGIGLLQTLTQIQEATLIYAPKIVAIFVTLLICLPLMGALMAGFMRQIAARIAGL
jgi:flagellar biosynthetic protein FliQ